MSRTTTFSLLVCCLVNGLSCTRFSSKEKATITSDKPNIIIIYTDQQRYNTIHALGNKHIQTPNLDRLVAEGIAFPQAFATAPVCVPSRTSFFSGMYPTNLQAYSNHHPGHRPATSLPLELRKQGYFTAVLGKNHSFLSEKDIDKFIPTAPFGDQPQDGRSAEAPMPWTPGQDPMHLLTGSTMELLDSTLVNNEQPLKKPVFLWLSYLYPHTPYQVPEPYFSRHQ